MRKQTGPRLMHNGFLIRPWPFDDAKRTVSGGHFGKLEAGYLAGLKLADHAREKIAEIRGSRDLTDAGKTKAIRSWLNEIAVPALRSAAAAVKAAEAYAASRRDSLAMRPDKTDVAGAMVRSDIRRHWLAMAPTERIARITTGEVDATTALALSEGPAELAGLTREQQARVYGKAVLASHPDIAEEQVDLDLATEAVGTAIRAAVELILKDGGFDRVELSRMIGIESRLDKILAPLRDEGDADSAAA